MRRIITVGREFGSGGREIGRRIAEELQIAYYDQEIITEIAKRTALSEAYIRQIEEKRPVVTFPIHIGHSFYLSPDPTLTIKNIAKKGPCVIVGRCADFILRDQKPIRIFSYADMPSKIKRCIDRRPVDENLSEAQMKKRIMEIDRSRAQYYSFFTEQTWRAKENFDLLANTSGTDIKKMSELLTNK